MNKIFALFLMFLLTTLSLTSQTNFGILAGFSHANTHIGFTAAQADVLDELGNFTPIGTFHAGIYLDRSLAEKAYLRAELLYAGKGSQSPTELASAVPLDETKNNFGYLSLPLLFGYRFGPISLEAGPAFNYKLSTKLRINGERFPESPYAYTQDFEFSVKAGVRMTFSRWNLGLHYDLGLSNLEDNLIFTDSNGKPIGEREARNRVVMLSVGYQLTEK